MSAHIFPIPVGLLVLGCPNLTAMSALLSLWNSNLLLLTSFLKKTEVSQDRPDLGVEWGILSASVTQSFAASQIERRGSKQALGNSRDCTGVHACEHTFMERLGNRRCCSRGSTRRRAHQQDTPPSPAGDKLFDLCADPWNQCTVRQKETWLHLGSRTAMWGRNPPGTTDFSEENTKGWTGGFPLKNKHPQLPL